MRGDGESRKVGSQNDADGSDDAPAEAPSAVGYRRPPKDTRFAKGQSGNPRGRPRGRKKKTIPYDAVLGQKVTIREGGRERRVTAAEAFVRHLLKRGLEGDISATRAALDLTETARATGHRDEGHRITAIVHVPIAPGSVSGAVEDLRMGRKMDRYRPTAHLLLEPWIVEAALARLGKRRLTLEEQEMVLAATRTPMKVRWPDWWGR